MNYIFRNEADVIANLSIGWLAVRDMSEIYIGQGQIRDMSGIFPEKSGTSIWFMVDTLNLNAILVFQ